MAESWKITTTSEAFEAEMLNTGLVVEKPECLAAQIRCSFFGVLADYERVMGPWPLVLVCLPIESVNFFEAKNYFEYVKLTDVES